MEKRIIDRAQPTNKRKTMMKRTLIAIAASATLALGSLAAYAHGHGHGGGKGGMGRGMWGNPLEHLTKSLDLTPEQQAQVKPVVDQARPQIKAIHEEAMQKTHAVMQNCAAQIRPLLTPQQQLKFDAIKKAHEDMLNAMKEMHQAQQQ